MSHDETRAALAAAMSTVAGVRGYPRKADVISPKAGDGWPLWRGMRRDDGSAFMNTWAVVIALDGDEVQADAWIEDHVDDLYDALESVMFIDSFEPAVTPLTGQSDGLALMITGRSE